MAWNPVPDAHGAYWYECRDGTRWSRGPGERYEWWSSLWGVGAVVPPWELERRRQQLNAMRMPNAHPIAIPPIQEDADTRRNEDTRRVTFATMPEENARRRTAVAEASGRSGYAVRCISALAIDAPPREPSTRNRVQNRPITRIRTSRGSPGSSSTIEAPGEHPQASVATAATAPRQPSSPRPPPPVRPPPGLGVEVHPPPAVRPAAELEPISITDARYRELIASNDFPDHPFTRWMEGANGPRPSAAHVWVLHDFAAYGELIGFSECDKSHYNVALKYFREMAQDTFEGRDMDLPTSPIAIPPLLRVSKGPQFTIDHNGPRHPFAWVEMIAHLSNTIREGQTQTDMALVVGAGIVSCVFKKDPMMYDHKIYQIVSEEKKLEMMANDTVATTWDFVFRRLDGSECALHPDRTKNLITYRDVCGPDGAQVRTIAPLVPKAGPGKSDGRGTFKRMTRQTADKSLKWDISTFDKRVRDA